MVDRCVMCGEIIPEGRQICPLCEQGKTTKTAEIKYTIKLPPIKGRCME